MSQGQYDWALYTVTTQLFPELKEHVDRLAIRFKDPGLLTGEELHLISRLQGFRTEELVYRGQPVTLIGGAHNDPYQEVKRLLGGKADQGTIYVFLEGFIHQPGLHTHTVGLEDPYLFTMASLGRILALFADNYGYPAEKFLEYDRQYTQFIELLKMENGPLRSYWRSAGYTLPDRSFLSYRMQVAEFTDMLKELMRAMLVESVLDEDADAATRELIKTPYIRPVLDAFIDIVVGKARDAYMVKKIRAFLEHPATDRTVPAVILVGSAHLDPLFKGLTTSQ